MRSIVDFFKKKWVIQLIGILAVSLLIWFFGPLVAIAGHVPWESDVSRLVTILILVLAWGIYNVLMRARAAGTDRKMVQELVDSGAAEAEGTSDASAAEVAVLSRTFDDALQTLKKARSQGARGGQYLYELPWYIIIGPPGSGKTTALINSGLEFPLADRFGKNAVKGVGGTRNCDWWFTDQAVLLDTAGRYTTQDSHEAVDKAAWTGFLELLRKHRPRRPVNGVLITMSLSDLIRQTEQERSLHARQIRMRILELQDHFGIQFPIYMLFTKCDLVAGFSEFFNDLTREERNQVWGVTFPEETLDLEKDVVDGFPADFDQLMARLDARLLERLQDERDLQRRQRMFGFPQRMAMLQEQLEAFLQETFGHNRYQKAPLLRGIYFTSGTQEGTPIDRLLGVMASVFHLDRQSAPVFSGKGRSFFIHRLLKDVIFEESQIAGVNRKVERRKLWLQRGSYGLAAVLTLAMAAGWFTSFTRNRVALDELRGRIAEYRAVAEATGDAVDLRSVLPRLDAAQRLREVYQEDVPWSMTFGLYQGDKLQPVADGAYRRLLQNFFLPLIVSRLEQRMVGPEADNPEILYELLRVYLMFGNVDRLDPNLVRPWVSIDWENHYTSDVQGRLLNHLDRLLAGPIEPVGLNEPLIVSVRATLTRVPVAQQVYMRIKSDYSRDHSRDFRLSEALGADAGRVFTAASGSLEDMVIPGLFTYDGFHQIFLKESIGLAKEMLSQNWVLGPKSPLGSLSDLGQLERDLKAFYFAEYRKRWDDLLANLKIRRIGGIHQAIEVLEYASGPDSPIRAAVAAVDKQTSLTRSPASALGALNKLKAGAESAVDDRMTRLLAEAKEGGVDVRLPEVPGKEVENAFEPVSRLVRGDGGSAPIDGLLAELNDLRNFFISLGATSDTGSAAVRAAIQRSSGGDDVIGRLRREAMRLPEPVKGWVETLASGSWGSIVGNVSSQLNKQLQSDVTSFCRSALSGRYPLAKGSSREATLFDFSRFFGPNGIMERFFNENLQPFVNTSGRIWRPVAVDNRAVAVSSGVLRQFQNADAIRKAFFQSGGQSPSVRFELKPVSLDSNVSRFRLNLDGQESVYRHGPAQLAQFQWPGPGGTGTVRISFETLDGRQVSRSEEGAWAWFRLLDRMRLEPVAQDRYMVTFQIEGLQARYELRAASVLNPFRLPELANFRCPDRL